MTEFNPQLKAEINEIGKPVEKEQRVLGAWNTLTGSSNSEMPQNGYLSTERLSDRSGDIKLELHRDKDGFLLTLDDFSFFKGEPGYNEAILKIANFYSSLKGVDTSIELVVPDILFGDAKQIETDINQISGIAPAETPDEIQEEIRPAA